MYKALIICMLFGLPSMASAQPTELLPELLTSYPSKDPAVITARIDEFVFKLEKKRGRYSDQDFLRLIFRESYKKFFDTYKPYTQFSELVEEGNYDCLSATSFLSVVLEAFKYEYKVIETNYHIFLFVQTEAGPVLLETTDRYNGIVTNPGQIEQRVSVYKNNELLIASTQSKKDHYKFQLNLYQEVQPHQLPGLLYYNQAVIAYNNNNLIECVARLNQARTIYESPRTSEFAIILVAKIVESDMNEKIKKDLIRPLLKYLNNSNTVIAAR